MTDAVRQLQRATTVPGRASAHLIRLAELGYVGFEFPADYPDSPDFGGLVAISVVRQPSAPPVSHLAATERFVIETLYGTAPGQKSVTLAPYMFPDLDKRLQQMAVQELRQKQYIEPTSIVPRLFLGAASVLVIGSIAVSLWSESHAASYVLALVIAVVLAAIAREPRGWKASPLGTQAIAQYTPRAQYASLSKAVRDSLSDPLWSGLQSPQRPDWLLSGGARWTDNRAYNAHTLALLTRSIETAAAPSPPPFKTATGQS